jgi:hypothetical protein
MRGLLITSILLSILLAGYAEAASYYVDYDAGSDTNSGLSKEAAWKHAPGDDNATGMPLAKMLAAGDVVKFKGGVAYLGTIKIKRSGAPGNPITYDGNSDGFWGTGKAIIDGEGDRLGISARKYGFNSPSDYFGGPNRTAYSYITINNFEIRNLRYVYEDNYWEQPEGVFFDGRGNGTESGIEIKNCYLHEIKRKSQAIDTEQGIISLTNNTFTDSVQDFTNYAGAPGNLATHKIQLSWLINGQKSDYYQASAYIGELNGSANSVFVYKNIYLTQRGWSASADWNPLGANNSGYYYWIYNLSNGAHIGSGGIGIVVTGYKDVKIHDNVIQQARSGISYSSLGSPSSDIQIYNNDISRVSWGINPVAGGDIFGNDLTNLQVYNNTIHDFVDETFYTEYDWGYHADGVFIFSSSINKSKVRGVKFYNNYFYGYIGGATALLYMSGEVSDVKIYNNVFASSAGAGYQIRTAGDRNTTSVRDIFIFNNAFARIPGEDKYSLAFERSSNISIKNNIFYLFEQMATCFSVPNGSTDGFSSDYNLLHSARVYKTCDLSLGGVCYSLEAWVQNTSFDNHSIIRKDPMFKSFPEFAAKTNASGTVTKAYLAANTNPNYNHTFAVGDHIEYNYDRTMRIVTEVGSNYIDFSPALSRISKDKETILDWKDIPTVTYDLGLKQNSPLLNNGTDLSSYIGTSDKNGVTRPQGPAWDIGAYEFVSGTACIHRSELPPCDGCVSDTDLTAFINRWYMSSTDVTLKELMEAIGLWKKGC